MDNFLTGPQSDENIPPEFEGDDLDEVCELDGPLYDDPDDPWNDPEWPYNEETWHQGDIGRYHPNYDSMAD